MRNMTFQMTQPRFVVNILKSEQGRSSYTRWAAQTSTAKLRQLMEKEEMTEEATKTRNKIIYAILLKRRQDVSR